MAQRGWRTGAVAQRPVNPNCWSKGSPAPGWAPTLHVTHSQGVQGPLCSPSSLCAPHPAGSSTFPQDLQLPSLERATPAAAGSPAQGSQGAEPVFTAWVLAKSLVSPQGSKRATFPGRHLIPGLEGSRQAAERLLHRSHRHAVPRAPCCRAAFYGTVVSASSLFPPCASPFLELSTPHSLLKILGTLEDNTIVYLLQLPCINGLPLLILEWNFWQKTSIQKGKWL